MAKPTTDQLAYPCSTTGDRALAEAGLSRRDLAEAFGITVQRVGQIVNGRGVSYGLADDLRRFINGVAGRPVCGNDSFILQPRKEGIQRRRPPRKT